MGKIHPLSPAQGQMTRAKVGPCWEEKLCCQLLCHLGAASSPSLDRSRGAAPPVPTPPSSSPWLSSRQNQGVYPPGDADSHCHPPAGELEPVTPVWPQRAHCRGRDSLGAAGPNRPGWTAAPGRNWLNGGKLPPTLGPVMEISASPSYPHMWLETCNRNDQAVHI